VVKAVGNEKKREGGGEDHDQGNHHKKKKQGGSQKERESSADDSLCEQRNVCGRKRVGCRSMSYRAFEIKTKEGKKKGGKP